MRGIEAEGEWRPTEWWTLRAAYAWLDPRITKSNDGDEGLRLGDVPRHSANASTEFTLPGTGVTLRGGVNHVSSRLLVNGSSVALPAYTLASIGASARLDPFTIDVAVNNLFDERYFTASGNSFAVYPGDPRTVSVRLGVGF